MVNLINKARAAHSMLCDCYACDGKLLRGRGP